MISEPCKKGTYRDSTTTFCIECGVGEQFTSDETSCGSGRINSIFFPSMFFAEGKKTSIDGLKWRDLVVVGW